MIQLLLLSGALCPDAMLDTLQFSYFSFNKRFVFTTFLFKIEGVDHFVPLLYLYCTVQVQPQFWKGAFLAAFYARFAV